MTDFRQVIGSVIAGRTSSEIEPVESSTSNNRGRQYGISHASTSTNEYFNVTTRAVACANIPLAPVFVWKTVNSAIHRETK